MESEKGTDGRVYVFLKDEDFDGTSSEPDKDEVLTRMEDEIAFLREELATRDEEIRRRDAVLLSLSEGLKALNPPPEERDPPVGADRASDTTEPQSATEGLQKPTPRPQEQDTRVEVESEAERGKGFWRRMFGG